MDKMSSLYAQYLSERTSDLILEDREGFATYRYLSKDQVYIIDLYVIPEARKQGVASMLANRICLEAKEAGCKELIGTVNPSTKGATESIKVLIAYGMHVASSEHNVIIFKKGL